MPGPGEKSGLERKIKLAVSFFLDMNAEDDVPCRRELREGGTKLGRGHSMTRQVILYLGDTRPLSQDFLKASI